MTDLLEIYNPANGQELSPEEIQAMQYLSAADVEALAKAYPNTATSNNYLVLLDKRKALDQQLFQLSTWENLSDLWKVNQSHFVAYGFRAQLHKKPALGVQASGVPALPTTPSAPAKANIDLSELEANQAEGLKLSNTNSEGNMNAGENIDGLHSIDPGVPALPTTPSAPAKIPKGVKAVNKEDAIPVINPEENIK